MSKRDGGDLKGAPDAKAGRQGADQLSVLKTMTSVVADSGDFEKIHAFMPEDATTNPSLILAASRMPQYSHIVDKAIEEAKKVASGAELVGEVCDQLAVLFGIEIMKAVPGFVSTEVDANLSFSMQLSYNKAKKILKMYKDKGADASRVLIKLASTWESIQACRKLESEGIKCNMTLLFSMPQAVACGQANAFLISPFVGRILDWFKKNTDKKEYTAEEDPGVVSVTKIYKTYAEQGYKTVVMGASFRNKGEVLALAGCHKLTISPALLGELQASNDTFERKLDASKISKAGTALPELTEAAFRWQLNEDAMGVEKLAEGIRGFNKDFETLKKTVEAKLA